MNSYDQAMNINERKGPSSDLLRTFLVVAGAGNVTQAAAQLGRTQSAISVQIRKLEEALSVSLFDRAARGVILSEDGQKLMPVARKAMAEIDQVAALFMDPLEGKIRVAIPDDYSESVLEQALAEFAIRHSQIEVFAKSGCSRHFPDAIAKHELDLALYSADPNPPAADVVHAEQTHFVARADFVLDLSTPLPLVLFDRHCIWRDIPMQVLDKAGIAWRVAYLSESFSSVRAAIAAGLGIGILANRAVEPTMRILGVEDGFPALPPSSLQLLRSTRATSKAAQAMDDALRRAIRS